MSNRNLMPLFEVFVRGRRGLDHIHVGSLHAHDAEQAMEYARSFCAPSKASMAVGHIKRAVQTGAEVPLEYGLALERELQAKLFASADAGEGLAAFGQKRAAEFRGE